MKRFTIASMFLFVAALTVALVPGTILAASHSVVTYGSVASTTDNSHGALASFDVTTPAGKSVTVRVNAKTKMISLSAAAEATGFQAGDSVLASGGAGKHKFAGSVRYDVAPFAIPYAHRTVKGKYASSTGPDLNGNGTLTIANHHGAKSLTFDTSSSTKYRLNGKKVASINYTAGERITVYAQEYTDGSWLAKRVEASKK